MIANSGSIEEDYGMKRIGAFLRIGFAVVVFGFGAVGWAEETGAATSKGKFEVRRVLNEGDVGSSEMLPMAKPQSGESELRVEKQALLREEHIQKVSIEKDSIAGRDEVQVTLTKEGAGLFAKVTKENIGKRLAVVVDGKVAIAPVIRSEIAGGALVISGNFTKEETREIARILTPAKAAE